jgi:predicted nucleic acid-binding protein
MADALVLVDTDVFIWLSRGKQQAARYARLVAGKRIVLSFATVAELWLGAETLNYNESSRRRLEGAIGGTTVVTPDNELTHRWAQLTAQARKAGHALGQPSQTHDAWIAATAQLYGLPLVTDDQHFDKFPGLTILRPEP